MKAISVGEFMNMPKRGVRVRDGEEVLLGPDPRAGELQRLFHFVAIESYQDMETLELVPAKLSEQAALEAIAKDDAACLELAAARGVQELGCSGCYSGAAGHTACSSVRGANTLKRAFAGLRSTYNPNLALVVSAASGVSAGWNALDVALLRKRIQSTLAAPVPPHVWLGMLDDLVIGKNATATLMSSVKFLRGNGLKIHQGGKLVVSGSSVKIRFLSAQGDLA